MPSLNCAWCSLVLCPLAPSWSCPPISPALLCRDSSVGGSPTCLAPLAVLLSPPTFSSQGLVVVHGLQGDSQGPNWLPMCLARVNGGCNFVAQSLLLLGCQPNRILNNHPDAGSLENVKAQSAVVFDTPGTGWLMASPGGWAVSSRGCPTLVELQDQRSRFSAQR